MEQNNRFEAGRFHAGRFCGYDSGAGEASFSVSVSGLTSNPTHGPTAEIGTQLIASAHGFSGTAPAAIAWQWRNGDGDIPGASDATYTPTAGDDLEEIYPVAMPSETYPATSGAPATVRFAPPQGAAVLGDIAFMIDSGTSNVATAGGFSGDNLSYDLTSDVPGLQIDGPTGLVTIATDNGTQSGTASISATNSGGTATQSIAVAIVADPFTVEISGLQNGSAQAGTTVTANVVWVVPEGQIDRIRWRSNRKAISGATGPSYVVDPSIVGTDLSCRVVTVANGANTSAAYPVSNGV